MNEEEQIALLHAANRSMPNGAVETQLLQLRAQAFLKMCQPAPEKAGSVVEADGEEYGLPVVSASDLDAAVLHQALATYGALHVRELLASPQAEYMRSVIDQALHADSMACAGAPIKETRPWFEPFDRMYGGDVSRDFMRAAGSMFAADSPRGIFWLFEMFYDIKIDKLLSEFFGERPALSVEKSAMRRVGSWGAPDAWHQDGTFLGPTIRSVNVWLTLSDCGTDAPSLEIVPRRLHRLLAPTSSYVTSHAVVQQEFPDAMIRPEFKAGDALLFDHFLLHRTWHAPKMTKIRYALETWFFAPSAFPGHYNGLYI